MVSHRFPVVMARGKHLFPFRTEQLSPSAPMVLGSQGPGRVGRRRFSRRGREPPRRAARGVSGDPERRPGDPYRRAGGAGCGWAPQHCISRRRECRRCPISAPARGALPRIGETHAWAVGEGSPCRRGERLGHLRSRSAARWGCSSSSARSVQPTSQSTASSSSSMRNERQSLSPASARCVSVEAFVLGNIRSHRTAALGRQRREHVCAAGKQIEFGSVEPNWRAPPATLLASAPRARPAVSRRRSGWQGLRPRARTSLLRWLLRLPSSGLPVPCGSDGGVYSSWRSSSSMAASPFRAR